MAKLRTVKPSKNLLIAIIAVILIIAIAVCVLYFAFPDTWDSLITLITGKDGGKDDPLGRGEGELAVHFIDVGQGDSILIRFPDGKDMLIDCGTTKKSTTDALEYLDNCIDDGQIDYLMLTHGDSDHVEYMDEVLDAYQVDTVYMPNILSAPSGTKSSAALAAQIAALDEDKLALFTDEDTLSSDVYAEFFIAALSEPNCDIVLNMDDDEDGNSIVITDGTYRLTFYCPTRQYYADTDLSDASDKNAISPVGILEYNGFRIVFTGDSNEQNEPIIADRIGHIDCDVLKVAHHGSHESSLDEFLAAVTCEYAVISCGAGNTHYHPRQEALTRIAAHGISDIYRTDNNGNVVLTVGEKLTFKSDSPLDRELNMIGADIK